MAKVESFNIVLIRCGETEWDESGRVVGQVDLPLSPEGASSLPMRLEGLEGAELSAILHGPDQCLLATAEAVARITGGKLRKVADLTGVGMGLWEGLRRQELEDKFPSAYRQWLENPQSVMVPEGEPLTEATDRLVRAIGRSVEKLRHPDPGVGVVLRPMSYALVSSWLTGAEITGASAMDCSAGHEWHEVSRARLREAREGAGVGS
jgi:broad specificity phosphatase PhoE